MRRQIITTADGSKTIQIEEWNEQYHSIHGAIQEAQHVFINAGLNFVLNKFNSQNISILEIGFGTGLNAYLTILEAKKNTCQVDYVGVEAYPVSEVEIKELNYTELIESKINSQIFDDLHNCSWEEKHKLSSYFKLTKNQLKFEDLEFNDSFNLIYFDAFGARVQPELWTEEIFQIMYQALKPKGILVTYSAKGSVRRAMQAVGFTVERLPGPPGKREMLRACKEV